MKIIPAIDIQEGKCVRLTQGRLGTTTVYSEDPVEMAKKWTDQGAEHLHIVDLDGAFAGAPVNRSIIRKTIRSVDIPVQVGGGIRTEDSIKYYIESGAKFIVLGTKVVSDTIFMETVTRTFKGHIIVGIDAKDGRVVVKGWTEASHQSAITVAQGIQVLQPEAIIYTDVNRDGMLSGPNLEAIKTLVEAVHIPVIASGGISQVSDIRTLLSLQPKKVGGVIIGKALYTGAIHLPDALAMVRSQKEC